MLHVEGIIEFMYKYIDASIVLFYLNLYIFHIQLITIIKARKHFVIMDKWKYLTVSYNLVFFVKSTTTHIHNNIRYKTHKTVRGLK